MNNTDTTPTSAMSRNLELRFGNDFTFQADPTGAVGGPFTEAFIFVASEQGAGTGRQHRLKINTLGAVTRSDQW
jgi:hypothetical protein